MDVWACGREPPAPPDGPAELPIVERSNADLSRRLVGDGFGPIRRGVLALGRVGVEALDVEALDVRSAR
jgi:hypothetical protein